MRVHSISSVQITPVILFAGNALFIPLAAKMHKKIGNKLKACADKNNISVYFKLCSPLPERNTIYVRYVTSSPELKVLFYG